LFLFRITILFQNLDLLIQFFADFTWIATCFL